MPWEGFVQLMDALPATLKRPLSRMARFARALPYRGDGRTCPVCERTSSHFAPHGRRPRPNARCAHCGALERHRLLWLYLLRKTDLFDGRPKSVLHVAPEEILRHHLMSRLGPGYLTADIVPGRAMVRMDITNIQYPDHSFDVIYCSHVLEHVPDDRRAMAELHRVLKPDGWAILLVPISGERTQDEPIDDPDERARRYGQADHLRLYGADYADRLCAAGFDVVVTTPDDLCDEAERTRFGLRGSPIFHCRPAQAAAR